MTAKSLFGFSEEEEKTLIKNATSTKLDKILNILNDIHDYIYRNGAPVDKVNSLAWVIATLPGDDLYTYDLREASSVSNLEAERTPDPMTASFQGYLHNFSHPARRSKKKSTAYNPINRAKLTAKTVKRVASRFSKDDSHVISESKKNILDLSNNKVFPNMFDKEFNIHNFSKKVPDIMLSVGKFVFTKFGLDEFADKDQQDTLFKAVGSNYLSVPYHNCVHGADVTLTTAQMVDLSDMRSRLDLDDLDLLAILYGAMVHDIGHPGQNNGFLINSENSMALTYNDRSVLENFHACLGMRVARESGLFDEMEQQDKRRFKRRVVELVLSTDMAFHAKWLSLARSCVSEHGISADYKPESLIASDCKDVVEYQQNLINFLVHSADISHNCKPFEISFKWTYMLMDEFWAQGDTEKAMNLPVSFLCDREDANVSHSQAGFIKGIILPNFTVLASIFPELDIYTQTAQENLDKWQSFDDELQKEEYK